MKPATLGPWAIGLAVIIFIFIQIGVSDFNDSLKTIDVWPAATVVALNLPLLILVTLRSRLVLTHMGHAMPATQLFSTVTLGFVAGSFTPGASGELLRTQALQGNAGLSAHDAFALVVFERALSFYLLVLTGAIGAAVLLLPFWAAAPAAILLASLCFLPLAASRILRLMPAPSAEPVTLRQRVLFHIRTTLARIEYLLNDRRLLFVWSSVTLATFALLAVQFWLLGRSAQGGGDVSPLEAFVAYAASSVMGIVGLLPLGLGTADASLVAVLTNSGLTSDQALVVTVLMRATITLPLVIVATAAYVHLAMQRRRLREAGAIS